MVDLNNYYTPANSRIKLGELIQKLSECDLSKRLFAVVENQPDEPKAIPLPSLCSYRGVYRDLAIEMTMNPERIVSVQSILNELRFAVGTEYSGYKGGEYLMTQATIVWLSNYGQCSGLVVVDVKEESDCVNLICHREDDPH